MSSSTIIIAGYTFGVFFCIYIICSKDSLWKDVPDDDMIVLAGCLVIVLISLMWPFLAIIGALFWITHFFNRIFPPPK